MPDSPTILSCDETLSFTEDAVMKTENEYRKCRGRSDTNPTLRDGKRVLKITCKNNPNKSIIERDKFDKIVNTLINTWRVNNLTIEQQRQFPPIYPPDDVMQDIYKSALEHIISGHDKESKKEKTEREKFIEDCGGLDLQIIAVCSPRSRSTYIQ